MILESIEAHNFRNLSGKIFWGSGLNIIYGNNGQGKTNWLEAIYLLSRTKSFRTQRLQESIRFGQEMAFIRGNVSSGSNFSETCRSHSRATPNQSRSMAKENRSRGISVNSRSLPSPPMNSKSCEECRRREDASSIAESLH